MTFGRLSLVQLDLGSDPAADRLVGRLRRLLLLLAVEHLQQLVGEIGGRRKRRGNDVPAAPARPSRPPPMLPSMPPNIERLRLLLGRVLAFRGFGACAGRPAREPSNRYRRNGQQPGQNQGTQHELTPVSLRGRNYALI